MNNVDKQYLDVLRKIMIHGEKRTYRNGDRYSLFGEQLRFDLSEGFPLLTTKKVFYKGIIHELLWFLSGETNIRYLVDNNVHIWDEWADENGNLGPVYGSQWRSWPSYTPNGFGQYLQGTIDQITNVINSIRNDPFGTRHIVSAWNPAEIHSMALPPCHTLFQFYVSTDGRLSCQLYQRSADWFLGVPFNIASYALLTHLMAHECDLKVGEFIHSFGDLHLYANHWEQAALQLSRTPMDLLPGIQIHDGNGIFGTQFEDIEIYNYTSHPTIIAEVSK